MQYRSSGIILKTQKLGEADRILKILTPENGLVSAIAKGARRMNSSFAAKTQTLNHCDFLLAKGKNLDIVSEVSIVNNFLLGCSDLIALNLAFFASEITEKISNECDSTRNFFELLDIYLRYLKSITAGHLNKATNNENAESGIHEQSDEIKTNQQLLLSIEFLWCIICELGYKPDLNTCALTRKRRQAKQIPQYFDLSSGSICSTEGYEIYRQGYHTDDHIVPLKKFTFKLLDALDRSPLSSLDTDFQVSFQDEDTQLNSPFNTENKKITLREILIEDFLVNYMQVSLGEIKSSLEAGVQHHQHQLDNNISSSVPELAFSLDSQNNELKSCLQLLYKHIEFQIHKECKSWKALEEVI
ncbi:MAG: DNA repair protein RecO [Proteobacteria bacterium]|nr:DNA repair protein RecO [Pseudomonadota bacterium]